MIGAADVWAFPHQMAYTHNTIYLHPIFGHCSSSRNFFAYNYTTGIDDVAASQCRRRRLRLHVVQLERVSYSRPHRMSRMNNAYQTQTYYSFELREREHYYLLCTAEAEEAAQAESEEAVAEESAKGRFHCLFRHWHRPQCTRRGAPSYATDKSMHRRASSVGRVASLVEVLVGFHFTTFGNGQFAEHEHRTVSCREPNQQRTNERTHTRSTAQNKRNARTYSLRI